MKGNKILVITSIIPTSLISKKEDENDILLLTEGYLKKNNPDLQMDYLFILPKVSWFLSFFSQKWRSYYMLSKKEYFYTREKKIYVLPVYVLPFKHFRLRYFLCQISVLLQKKRLSSLLNSLKPNLIHSHNIDLNSALARIIKKEYNLPYVVTFRGNPKFDQTIYKNLSSASEIITLTHNENRHLEQSKLEIDSVVIPHGISDDFFDNYVGAKNKKVEKKLKLITVSRLLDWKNIGCVIESLYKVNFEFEYTVYGDGPEFNALKKLILERDLQHKVFLKGRISHDEVKSKLEESDLFILMSYPETFGRVFLEAIACGLPIVAHKGVGIESFFYKKNAGIFTDCDNLVKELNSIAGNCDMLEKMSRNARELAKDFSWDIIAKKINHVYEKNKVSL